MLGSIPILELLLPRNGPGIPSECQQRPVVAVKMVVNHEPGRHIQTLVFRFSGIWQLLEPFAHAVAGKTGAGEERFVPRAVLLLGFGQVPHTPLGGVALVLAAVGVYGVVSYSTAQRTREFGIRSALGADPRRIARLVLREAVVLAVIGVSVGLLLAAGLSRVLATVLYEVDPWSPLTFLLVSVVLTLVALGASAVPAQRATRVDPMVALRAE